MEIVIAVIKIIIGGILFLPLGLVFVMSFDEPTSAKRHNNTKVGFYKIIILEWSMRIVMIFLTVGLILWGILDLVFYFFN